MEFRPSDQKAVFQSKEGKQLLEMLQADGGQTLARAAEALKAGDTAKAVAMLQPLMDSPASQQLIQEINRKRG